jgi:hypothetical protein
VSNIAVATPGDVSSTLRKEYRDPTFLKKEAWIDRNRALGALKSAQDWHSDGFYTNPACLVASTDSLNSL